MTTDTAVTLSYSNAWWRIDTVTLIPKTGTRIFESCMTIPDGIRYIAYPPDALGSNGKKLTPAATACSMLFPAPGREALFVSWLTLCPRPKLPIIDSTHMHRLIYIPQCETSILHDARNLGTYSIGYADDANIFLSDLRIRNNGVDIELRPSESGFASVFHQLPPPFDKGFLEFEFTLLATTNYHGFAFPARSVVKRMYPAFDAKEPDRLFTRVLSEIQVLNLSGLKDGSITNEELPKQLLTYDLRPTNLPVNTAVNYLNSDDAWKPTSDPQIKHLAELQRQRAGELSRSSQSRSPVSVARMFFFGIVLMPIAVYALRRLYRRGHNRNP